MNKTVMKWLEEVRALGWKPGLSRVKSLLRRLGNPQNHLDIIHITGTNGKGSTATLLHNVLVKGGYKTGQFSSPSILGFEEMFLIDGQPISEVSLTACIQRIQDEIQEMLSEGEDHPTEYEILSAIMYLYFFEEHVDFAIVEVAMGGENDCTNVMDYSIQSIITPIAMDHSDFLGDTLLDIAKEKAGVIKPNSVLITHPQSPEVMTYLADVCESRATVLKTFDPVVDIYVENMQQIFTYKGLRIETQLMGQHQCNNIAGVLESIYDLKVRGYMTIDQSDMLEAIASTVFPGRFERLGHWILDGAHNNASLLALAQTMESLDLEPMTGVLGVLGDKDIDEGLTALKPYIQEIVLTEPDNPRKLSVHLLKAKVESLGYQVKGLSTDLDQVIEMSGSSALIFGSFYLIGPMRQRLIMRQNESL